MNFETGVISVSSFSIGAWAVAAPTALIARTSARTTLQNRRMWLLLIYVPARITLPPARVARLRFVHLVASRLAGFPVLSPSGAGPQPQPPYGSPRGPLASLGSHRSPRSTAPRQPSCQATPDRAFHAG